MGGDGQGPPWRAWCGGERLLVGMSPAMDCGHDRVVVRGVVSMWYHTSLSFTWKHSLLERVPTTSSQHPHYST